MNLQDFKVTYTGASVPVELPNFVVTGKVMTDDGTAVIADFSADADGIPIAPALATLPVAKIADLLESAGLPEQLLLLKAGVLS